MACHAGLGVSDERPDDEAALDFAQSWVGRGADCVSNLGWAYVLHRTVG